MNQEIINKEITLFLKENEYLLSSLDYYDKNELNDSLKTFIDKHYECKSNFDYFKYSNAIIGNDLKNIQGDIKKMKIVNLIKNAEREDKRDREIEEDTIYMCCCGKRRLSNLYIIKYDNGNSLLIGSSCIKKYDNDKLNKQLKTKRKNYKNKQTLRESIEREFRNCRGCSNNICNFHKQRKKDYKKGVLGFCKKRKCNNIINKDTYEKCYSCNSKK